MRNRSAQRVAVSGLLTSLMLVLGLIERQFPLTAAIPGIKLGLANSETAAQTAFASYQRKYSDLEGKPALIRKAEVNGSTIYRVRVGPLSKEEASSLCSKLQGQGGQCFVAKN